MKFKDVKWSLMIIIFVAVLSLPVFVFKLGAQENFNHLSVYGLSDFNLEKQISLIDNARGYNLSDIDLGGDGQSEILLSAGPGQKPRIKLLRGDGSLINEFMAYGEGFLGGVNVTSCDLDADGRDEIVTGVRSKGGPHVRIFDGYGRPKISTGFFAFDKNINSGVQVGCADINADGRGEIVAVGGPDDDKKIRIFESNGTLIAERNLEFKNENAKISPIDLGGDGRQEILVSAGWGSQPKVQIFRGDLSLVNEFLVYDSAFSGGVNVFGIDVDGDRKDELVTLPSFLGGSHVRIFDGYGQEKITSNTFVGSENFIGGLSFAVADFDGDGNLELVTAPENLPTGRTDLYKYIDVDVSDQRFRYYQQGFLIDDLPTSTGKPSTPTRLGEFTAFSKYEMAYGYADGVKWGMPYFIGFYTSGSLENGIHELPFLNGYREGESSLGAAVSHGCVRLAIGSAKEVYDWVEVNKTQVIVHK